MVAMTEKGKRMSELRSICYKCSYVASVAASTCPACRFPFIIETSSALVVAPSIEQLFDRTSVRVGAPPLPGVDEGPRKAQLLAEARRRRAEHKQRQAAEGKVVAAPADRSRLPLGVVGFGAVVAGALAAVLVHGII
jgi:hypothetical protein